MSHARYTQAAAGDIKTEGIISLSPAALKQARHPKPQTPNPKMSKPFITDASGRLDVVPFAHPPLS
jgi:hypothetical protein